MTIASDFIPIYDQDYAGRLAHRSKTFRRVFELLDLHNPADPLIVETGCARKLGNWEGDGQSTLLWDAYVTHRGAGQVYSVDIDPEATAIAADATSDRVDVATSDSVIHLHHLCRKFVAEGRIPDVVYLDSFDVDFDNPVPSAVHHLMEFCAIGPALGPKTILVIDDCPKLYAGWLDAPEHLVIQRHIGHSGKGKFLIDYLMRIGAAPIFNEYQVGFLLNDAAMPKLPAPKLQPAYNFPKREF